MCDKVYSMGGSGAYCDSGDAGGDCGVAGEVARVLEDGEGGRGAVLGVAVEHFAPAQEWVKIRERTRKKVLKHEPSMLMADVGA